jgi:hypothetical protein
VVLLVLLIVAVADGAPDNGDLARRLDRTFGELTPGRTLRELTAKLSDSLVYAERSTAALHTVYLVRSARASGHSAWQAATCEFDADGRLARCVREGKMQLTEAVAEADWNKIGDGATLRTVYATIGPPGEPILSTPPGYDSALEYMVRLTKPTAYFSSCAGRILLRHGIVAAKELMCE